MKRLYTLLTIAGFALAAPAFAGGSGCDYNGDGACDQADQDIIVAAQGTQEGDPGYVPAADLDGDGVISPADLSAFLDLRGS